MKYLTQGGSTMKNRIDSIKTILNRFIIFGEPMTKEDMIEARDIISSLAKERDDWRGVVEEIIEDKVRLREKERCKTCFLDDCDDCRFEEEYERQQIGFEYGLHLNFPYEKYCD